MRAVWWVGPLVPVLASMLAASCGGGVAGSGGNPDAGGDAISGSGCAPLEACCGSLPPSLQSLCDSVVMQGNADDCATELGQLAATGHCGGQVPGDAGDATMSSSSGSSGGGSGGGSGSGSSGGGSGSSNGSSGGGIDGSGSGGSSGSSSGGPGMCDLVPPCTPPLVCVTLPGESSGSCGTACQSNADCPAFTTCSGGTCSWQCTSCPVGQECGVVGGFNPRPCSSNADCGIGSYCDIFPGQGDAGPPQGMCQPYTACTECVGGCTSCTVNSQCQAGEVCVGGSCQACTTSSQCGPAAQCTASHTGLQCTCSISTDCAAGEICSGGICTPTGNQCYPDAGGPPGCPTGQLCINGTCGPCTSFNDCNAGYFGPQGAPGLACINGVCTNCTANSQCGGGEACVGGTCGTCAINSQCGPTGQCTDGFCTCTTDQQCATGQRCGAGVCVAM